VIGVNSLDGDGIGAPAPGAGSGIVFAVELRSEAIGNRAPIGVFAPSRCIWRRRRFLLRAGEVFWNRHGIGFGFSGIEFPSTEKWIALRQ
jgi:hypothetical protein